jgi:two-component system cell cycle sensor histidine kinase/response regulator CckA
VTESKRPVEYVHRVLVVEDDYQLAELLSEVLTYENCIADIAANGMEAMDMLRGADYEAVICDLMMPRVDGESLYNEVIRQYPYLAEKFIFITGNPGRRAGLADFIYRTGNTLLEKPFEMEQLRTALKELFAR